MILCRKQTKRNPNQPSPRQWLVLVRSSVYLQWLMVGSLGMQWLMFGSSWVYTQRLLVGSSGIQWMMGGSLGVQWLLVGSLGVQWLMVVGTSSVNTSKYTIAGPLGQKHNGWSEKCYCSPIVYYSTRRFSQRCTTATTCLLYTSPSPRDKRQSRMPSSA